jgi:hypothetical protein
MDTTYTLSHIDTEKKQQHTFYIRLHIIRFHGYLSEMFCTKGDDDDTLKTVETCFSCNLVSILPPKVRMCLNKILLQY